VQSIPAICTEKHVASDPASRNCFRKVCEVCVVKTHKCCWSDLAILSEFVCEVCLTRRKLSLPPSPQHQFWHTSPEDDRHNRGGPNDIGSITFKGYGLTKRSLSLQKTPKRHTHDRLEDDSDGEESNKKVYVAVEVLDEDDCLSTEDNLTSENELDSSSLDANKVGNNQTPHGQNTSVDPLCQSSCMKRSLSVDSTSTIPKYSRNMQSSHLH